MGQVIKLGLPGALRDYTTEQQGNGLAWERGPANPFAARVNSSGKYDEVDIWNDWVQEDWQAGVGRVDPEEGGFLYAEAETRVPGQVILPPLMQQCDTRVINNTTSDCRYMPTSVAGTVTVGSGGHARAAMSFTTPNPVVASDVAMYCFYARVDAGVPVKIDVYSNSGGSPNGSIVSTTFVGHAPDRNFFWYGVRLSSASLSAATQYWVVIEPSSPTDAIDIVYATSGYDTPAKGYNGSVWANIANTYLFYTTDHHRLPHNNVTGRGLFRFNGALYTTNGEELYKFDTTNENWDSVGNIPGSGGMGNLAVFGPTVFFGRNGGNYTTMNTAESFTAAGTTGRLFLEFGGYLYRAVENDVYYSSDGSTWSSAIPVGGDDATIRGMAGMGDSLYLATNKALFRLAPGDIVEEVVRFGAENSDNGVGMIEYNGALYIPAHGRLFRFDQSGQMMDVWIGHATDLLSTRIGQVASLTRMNNWLVAHVIPTTSDSRPTIWIWQEEGWHHIVTDAQAPPAFNASSQQVFYDRGTSRLWYTSHGISTMFVEIDDYTINPFNSTTYLYQPYGWLEQDRFYGGQYLLNKSWESVTIVGDNLGNITPVTVYFQDEESTGWERLGTTTEDGFELRWDNYATRPKGKWVKIGVLLQTSSGTETPRIRAIIVKFLPMVNDRITDNLTLTLKDNIQMPDGDPSDYTLLQQKAHIQSLIDSINPFIYEDPFGEQYEITFTSWRFMVTRFEHINGANVVSEMRVPLVLEQLPETVYPRGEPMGLLLALANVRA